MGYKEFTRMVITNVTITQYTSFLNSISLITSQKYIDTSKPYYTF